MNKTLKKIGLTILVVLTAIAIGLLISMMPYQYQIMCMSLPYIFMIYFVSGFFIDSMEKKNND